MSPVILKILLMANSIQVPVPQETAQAEQVISRGVDHSGKMKAGVKNCYPWFHENNYECPSAKRK